jgi:hypothetical protein
MWRLLLCFKSRESINVVLAFFMGFMMVLHHHLFQNTIACSKSNMAKQEIYQHLQCRISFINISQ